MRVHRILSSAAAAVVLAALPVTQASAVTVSDVKGPKCADVTDGAPLFQADTVLVRLTLAAPSCTSVTYTLYVLSADGSTLLATSSQTGTGTAQVFYSVPVTSTSTVCVYATTSVGQHVFDRAPDSGCIVLVEDAGFGPAQAMR